VLRFSLALLANAAQTRSATAFGWVGARKAHRRGTPHRRRPQHRVQPCGASVQIGDGRVAARSTDRQLCRLQRHGMQDPGRIARKFRGSRAHIYWRTAPTL